MKRVLFVAISVIAGLCLASCTSKIAVWNRP